MPTYKPFVELGPGDSIRAELEYYGWDQKDLAEVLDLSEKHVSQLLNNKVPVTFDVACRLSRAFRQSPQFWLNLDAQYRLRLQESAAADQTAARALIYRYMPVREMRQKGWLPADQAALVPAVLTFWGWSGLRFDETEQQAACFRKSDAHRQFNPFFALTWLQQARNTLAASRESAGGAASGPPPEDRRPSGPPAPVAARGPECGASPRATLSVLGQGLRVGTTRRCRPGRARDGVPHTFSNGPTLAAATTPVPRYSERSLQALVRRIPELTLASDGVARFLTALRQAGVAFLNLPHLEKTYTDGASFRHGRTPVLVYTARYDRLDNFWFTVAHEIGHIVQHLRKDSPFFIDSLEGLDLSDGKEKEADQFARDALRCPLILNSFEGVAHVARTRVLDCARRLGLHPAVVVGCLQYHRKLDYQALSDLKAPVRDQLAAAVTQGLAADCGTAGA